MEGVRGSNPLSSTQVRGRFRWTEPAPDTSYSSEVGQHIYAARRFLYAARLVYRFSRHWRSKGSRHALGLMSWWMAFGPQLPGA